MVAISYLAWLLPVIILIAYLITLKPELCRQLLVITASKVFAFVFKEIRLTGDPVYVCQADAQLAMRQGINENCFVMTSFFTFLVLSSIMSMNDYFKALMDRLNFALYSSAGAIVFLFALYGSKLYLMQSRQTVLITSIELGMGFAVLMLAVMTTSLVWPVRFSTSAEVLPEENILVAHLKIKFKLALKNHQIQSFTGISPNLRYV